MRNLKYPRAFLLASALLALCGGALFADSICFKVPGGKAYGCRGDDFCRRQGSGNWECVPQDGENVYPARALSQPQQTGFGAGKDGGVKLTGMSGFMPLFLEAERISVKKATAKTLQAKINAYTQAIAAWKESDGNKNKALAYANRGFVRALLKDYDGAENDFGVAVKKNPGDPLPHTYLGHLYYTQEKFEQAVISFRRAFSFGLDEDYADQSSEAHRLHDNAIRIIEAKRLAEARQKAEKELREKEQLRRDMEKAAADALAKAQALEQEKARAARAQQGAVAPVYDPALTAQDPRGRGAGRPKRGGPGKSGEEPAPKKKSDWVGYCVIGMFLTTAFFLLVTYLVLKKDQRRIRQELGPLAKELGVDVKWMFVGLFIPPDTEFHGKLMVTLVVCAVLGFLGAGFVFFFSPHHEVAIKILSGPLISGAIVCLSVFGSYSLKTSAEGRTVTLPSQTGWTPAAAPADYKPTFTEDTVLPDVPSRPETSTRTLRSSSARARQIRSMIDTGNFKEALEMFSKKSPLKITDADKDQLVEIYIGLGDFERAGTLFDALKGSALLAQNLPRYEAFAGACRLKGGKDLSRRICRGLFEAMKNPTASLAAGAPALYQLAGFCEGADDGELARDIYKHMIDSGYDKFKDTAARYEELKTRLFIAVAAPAPSVPAAAAAAGGPIGQVLNNQYELKGELGEGGMAKVYEGLDRKTRKKVAVKKMHPWLKKFPEEHKRFVQEAKIVSRLTHPNIVGVQAIVEQEGEIYLIFDYVDGKTLADVLKEKGLMQFQECKHIFKGICDAVYYAHKANVIHRDLKPSNIMVTKENQALVMDFGLASELRESLTRVTHQTTSGTPAYMAPEQYVGIVKRESDIYAMGVCLYEMLTGKLPFMTGDIMQLKNDRSFRAASSELPWLPAGIDDIISRALAPEPSQRFADTKDFYDAIDKL